MNSFSFVLPVYNTPIEILSRCILSIRKIMLDIDEIIVVDDGSNELLARQYDAFSSSNTFIYHNQNKGVSNARNFGLIKSTNEWVWFVDPDDYLLDTDFESIREKLDKSVDFYIMDYYWKNKDNINRVSFFSELRDKEQLFLALTGYNPQLTRNVIGWGVVWSQIYNRSFLINNNILFDERCIRLQDNNFNILCVDCSKKYELLNTAIYIYVSSHFSDYYLNYKNKMEDYLPYIADLRYNYYKKMANEKVLNANNTFIFWSLFTVLRLCVYNSKCPIIDKKVYYNSLHSNSSYMQLCLNRKNFSFLSRCCIDLFSQNSYFLLGIVVRFKYCVKLIVDNFRRLFCR